MIYVEFGLAVRAQPKGEGKMNNLIMRGMHRTKRFLLIDEVAEVFGAGGRAAVAAGIATIVNYLAWLGWDQTRDFHPDVMGAYEPWQFVGLALGLAVIAVVAGWGRHPWEAVIAVTVVMLLCVTVSGTMANADGLFIIGAFVAASHTFTIVGPVALVADEVGGRKSHGRASPGWHRQPWVWIVLTVMLMLNILYWTI